MARDDFSMRLEGTEDLERMVKVLSPRGRRRVWRNALRSSGQKTIGRKAKKNLRAMGHRGLAKQVKTKATASATNVQARVGARKDTRLSRIGHLLEKGTPPHIIRARRKKVLAGGGEVFGRTVQHPGHGPKPWLIPALEAKDKLAQELAVQIDREIQKARARGL